MNCKGIALVTGLLILAAISLIGITAAGSMTMQRKQAANFHDKTVALANADVAESWAKAWLFSVTRNRALDLLRKDKRMSFTSDLPDLATSSPPSADVLAVVNEQQGQVLSALGDLPSLQQDVLRLKFQNEFTYKQIAEITGKSVSHVGVLIHDGLTALRNQFRTLDLLS